MASIRDIEFFARPIGEHTFSLRHRFKKSAESDPDGTEWAILFLDHAADSCWSAKAAYAPFQKTLDEFLGKVMPCHCDRKVALQACRYAYEAHFHGEETEEGPYEGIAALADLYHA